MHLGKPKCWYGIPPSEADKFDEVARAAFPGAYQECTEFMRHKTYHIYPPLLRKQNVTVHKYLNNINFLKMLPKRGRVCSCFWKSLPLRL